MRRENRWRDYHYENKYDSVYSYSIDKHMQRVVEREMCEEKCAYGWDAEIFEDSIPTLHRCYHKRINDNKALISDFTKGGRVFIVNAKNPKKIGLIELLEYHETKKLLEDRKGKINDKRARVIDMLKEELKRIENQISEFQMISKMDFCEFENDLKKEIYGDREYYQLEMTFGSSYKALYKDKISNIFLTHIVYSKGENLTYIFINSGSENNTGIALKLPGSFSKKTIQNKLNTDKYISSVLKDLYRNRINGNS